MGSNSKVQRGLETKKQSEEPQDKFFSSSSLCLYNFFLFLFILPFSFFFYCFHFFFCILLFSFFFSFSTSHKKMKWWRQRNFHKTKYKSLTLVSKTIPRPLFSLKFRTTWIFTFWLVMSYKMKEGVKISKRVTMDINAR